jgi:2-hydroxycyclohexanecarboxyl-CoA dehydrogenase
MVGVVTGCGSPRGIGYATAMQLARDGWSLALLDAVEDSVTAAASAISEETGAETLALRCDVAVPDAVAAAIQATLDRFGRIDAVVNNAGITAPTALADISEGEWDQIFAVDVKGVFLVTQAALPFMRARGYGRIVNLSSVSAKRGGGIFGGAHYSAAKAAVLGLTKAVAREVARDGITCNAVAPGLIETDITAGKLTAERRQKILEDIPVGRLGAPADVAAAIVYLCSPAASYVTGEEIDVNGGMHID